jgi:hypothetical protein
MSAKGVRSSGSSDTAATGHSLYLLSDLAVLRFAEAGLASAW